MEQTVKLEFSRNDAVELLRAVNSEMIDLCQTMARPDQLNLVEQERITRRIREYKKMADIINAQLSTPSDDAISDLAYAAANTIFGLTKEKLNE